MTCPFNIDSEALERSVGKRRHDADFERRPEAEIRSDYIDPLLEALG